MLLIIIIGGIIVLFIYIARLASKEIFSPSNKIHREVGRAKDLSAPRYEVTLLLLHLIMGTSSHVGSYVRVHSAYLSTEWIESQC